MDDDVVNMHLYQPCFQDCIVDIVTDVPILRTNPDAKSKSAKRLKFCPPMIYAKSLVSRRKKRITSSWLPMPKTTLYILSTKNIILINNKYPGGSKYEKIRQRCSTSSDAAP